VTHKITPCLWFDTQAEEATNFYVSVFKNSKVTGIQRYAGDAGPLPDGTVVTTQFELDSQPFMALNGGPHVQFTDALSMFVSCEDQREVDELWDKLLSDGGSPSMCGWLKDRYGVSWQIVPKQLGELLGDSDQAKAGRVMEAMLKMVKLDVAALQAAYDRAA
jgi:predicted 3-demethylubiquinone-9 3-methyltransferase (glyoxalase superfamily)